MAELQNGERPGFQEIQYAFAAHLRDPEANPAPADIEPRRMRIYTELFYKNIEGFLANNFPVLRKLYSEVDWHALVRAYYAQHESHSPQFYQIAGEFLEYLQHEHKARDCDPPFLLELAHYEWVEMILAIDPAVAPPVNASGDLMEDRPLVTPWLRNLSYTYDVHRIGQDYRPDKPPDQPSFLAVYRKSNDDISFMALNAMTSRLLQQLIDQPARSGREHLLALAQDSGMDAQRLLNFGAELLEDMRQRGMILGTTAS